MITALGYEIRYDIEKYIAFGIKDITFVINKENGVIHFPDEIKEMIGKDSAKFIYYCYAMHTEKFFTSIPKMIEKKLDYIEIPTLNGFNIYDELMQGRVLLNAITGKGKSYLIDTFAKAIHKNRDYYIRKDGKKGILMLMPLTSLVRQKQNAVDVPHKVIFEGMDGKIDDEVIIYSTFDGLNKIDINTDEYYIVVDEAHELLIAMGYRNKALENVYDLILNREQVLYMTATENDVNMDFLFDRKYLCTDREKENRTFSFKEIKGKYADEIASNVKLIYDNGDEYQIVFIENKRMLNKIAEVLIDNGVNENDITVITSENKLLQTDILDNNDMPSRIVLATSSISVGINILKQERNFVFHLKMHDVNVNLQEINRVRCYKCNKAHALIYMKSPKDIMPSYDNAKNIILRIIGGIIAFNDGSDGESIDIEHFYKYKKAIKNQIYLRYLIYKMFMMNAINSKPYIIKCFNSDGWEYVDKSYDYEVLSSDKEMIVSNDGGNDELVEIFDKIYDNFTEVGYADYVKMSADEQKIYEAVKNIKNHSFAFDGNDVDRLKEILKNSGVKYLKREVNNKIKKFAYQNIEKLDGESRAVIIYHRKMILDIIGIKKSIKLKTIKNELKLNYNINLKDGDIKLIMKSIGFRFNQKNKMFYKVK